MDVLATDVYSGSYKQENYRQLTTVAGDKPITLGEAGIFPTVAKFKAQPRWTWFMSWRDPDNFFSVSLEELPWVDRGGELKVHYPVLK